MTKHPYPALPQRRQPTGWIEVHCPLSADEARQLVEQWRRQPIQLTPGQVATLHKRRSRWRRLRRYNPWRLS